MCAGFSVDCICHPNLIWDKQQARCALALGAGREGPGFLACAVTVSVLQSRMVHLVVPLFCFTPYGLRRCLIVTNHSHLTCVNPFFPPSNPILFAINFGLMVF